MLWEICQFLYKISSLRKRCISKALSSRGLSRGIAREEERTRGGKYSNRSRSFGIKAPRVIDWCSGGYTPASRTNRGVRLCAWELLKAERIRREKTVAVKKGTECALPSFVRSDVTDISFSRTRLRLKKTERNPRLSSEKTGAGRFDDAFVWNRIIETSPAQKCPRHLVARFRFFTDEFRYFFINAKYQ